MKPHSRPCDQHGSRYPCNYGCHGWQPYKKWQLGARYWWRWWIRGLVQSRYSRRRLPLLFTGDALAQAQIKALNVAGLLAFFALLYTALVVFS